MTELWAWGIFRKQVSLKNIEIFMDRLWPKLGPAHDIAQRIYAQNSIIFHPIQKLDPDAQETNNHGFKRFCRNTGAKESRTTKSSKILTH